MPEVGSMLRDTGGRVEEVYCMTWMSLGEKEVLGARFLHWIVIPGRIPQSRPIAGSSCWFPSKVSPMCLHCLSRRPCATRFFPPAPMKCANKAGAALVLSSGGVVVRSIISGSRVCIASPWGRLCHPPGCRVECGQSAWIAAAVPCSKAMSAWATHPDNLLWLKGEKCCRDGLLTTGWSA